MFNLNENNRIVMAQLPDTLAACHAMTIDMAREIEQLQRRSFSSLKDRAQKYDGPSLFEELDKEAELAKAKALEKAAKEVDARLQRCHTNRRL